MTGKQIGYLIIVISVSVGIASSGFYFLFDQRLTALEVALATPPASVAYVDKLQSIHADNLEQLATRLTNMNQALIKYVDDRNQLGKETLLSKIEQTNQAVAKLLTVIEQREQVTATLIPPGTVVAYAGPLTTEVQQQLLARGWLVCDGKEYPIEDYPALYQVMKTSYGESTEKTFKIPDFRGMFLRGLDLERQIDPERKLGSYQEDSYKTHTHNGSVATAGLHEHEGATTAAGEHHHRLLAEGYWFTSKTRNERRAITGDVDDNQAYATTDEGEHTHPFKIERSGAHEHPLIIGESGEQESRPKNYPVIYLIKF